MDELQEMIMMETTSASSSLAAADLLELAIRFLLNTAVIFVITRFFYYPKSKRRDYFFTFFLISISVFFLIFLLSSVKLKIGFALGLFAIFGIIRYRTESVPIREMTYLFVIIAISVINALGGANNEFMELLVTNLIFIVCTWITESNHWLRHVANKLIMYDKIELITPDRNKELIADLEARTGLKIEKVEVGHIDFIRDMAMVKIYYDPRSNEINTVDNITRFPKENE